MSKESYPDINFTDWSPSQGAFTTKCMLQSHENLTLYQWGLLAQLLNERYINFRENSVRELASLREDMYFQ